MDSPVIGISGINAVDNPGPGTGVARSLREDRELGASLVGLAYDAMEPGLYMDWLFDRRYMMPYPSSDPEALVERLLHIQRNSGLDCVIPNFDVELPVYQRCADQLAGHGIRVVLPTPEQYRLRSKEQLPRIAPEMGVAVPRTRSVSSLADMHAALAELGYPAMVKGPFYKAYRVANAADASARFHQLVSEWGYPVIVQQVVTGTELNLVCVGDGEGGHLGMVAIKKMWITEAGKIWTGVTVRNRAMTEAAEAFLAHTRWRGPFEMECIADEDGTVHLIEINPRFPAWVYFATGVGLNLPAALARFALGLPQKDRPDYEAGKLFVRYTYEIVTDSVPLATLVASGER